MWVAIDMARSLEQAEHIKSALEKEGFLVQLKSVYKKKSGSGNFYEIRVLETEAEEARNLLLDLT